MKIQRCASKDSCKMIKKSIFKIQLACVVKKTTILKQKPKQFPAKAKLIDTSC